MTTQAFVLITNEIIGRMYPNKGDIVPSEMLEKFAKASNAPTAEEALATGQVLELEHTVRKQGEE